MATAHSQQNQSVLVHSYWPHAALLGGLAGAIRPLISAVGVGPQEGVLMTLPEFQLWWTVHIGYSVLFGAGFGIVAYHGLVRPYSESIPTGAVLGLGYGVGLWFVNIVVAWNLFLADHVLSMAETVDPFATGPIFDHVLFAIILGVLYAAVVPRLAPRE